MTEPPYDNLDPGVRLTVRWLYEGGWRPVDSGDGRSKGPDGQPCPHVYLKVADPDHLVAEAARLARTLRIQFGVTVQPCTAEADGGNAPPQVQATYDPADNSAILILVGVDDARLFPGSAH